MEGLIIGGNFAFQNGLGLTIKAADVNCQWAYIREGLLSEGHLRLRFGRLIFGRAFFWEGLLWEFYGVHFKGNRMSNMIKWLPHGYPCK